MYDVVIVIFLSLLLFACRTLSAVSKQLESINLLIKQLVRNTGEKNNRIED
jgi:hypothetical protein